MSEVQVTLEQVQELVQTNEDVRNALKGHFLTSDAVNGFLETEEGKTLIQPKIDSHVSKGINTWKLNNLEDIKKQAILEANPSDTPEQRQIKELSLQVAEANKKATFAAQETFALGVAAQRGIPQGLVKEYVGSTNEETLSGLNRLENEFKSALQIEVEKVLGSSSRQSLPPNPNTVQGSQAPARSFEEMSLQEKQTLYRTNPNEYARLSQQ